MIIRADIIIQVVGAPRWDRAATIVWRATVERGAQRPLWRDDAWFQRVLALTDHARSRSACATMASYLRNHNDLAICWRLLAIDPQNPAGLSDLLTDIGTAIRGVDFDEHPQLLARYRGNAGHRARESRRRVRQPVSPRIDALRKARSAAPSVDTL